MDLNQNDLSNQVAQAYKSATGVDMPSEKLAQRVSEIGGGQTSFGDWQTALQASDRAQLAQAYKAATGNFADQGALESLRTQYQSGAPADYGQFVSSHIPSGGLQIDTGFGNQATPAQQSVIDSFANSQTNAPSQDLSSQIAASYKQATGVDMPADKLAQRTAEISSGQTTLGDWQSALQASDRAQLAQAYHNATGQYLDESQLEDYVNQVKAGTSGLDAIKTQIAPVQYFGDVYARDENGNLIRTQGADEFGNPVDGGGYQKSNTYGFQWDIKPGENWEQATARYYGNYYNAVETMYDKLLGRPATKSEIDNIVQNYGGGIPSNIDLQQIQKDLLFSPEAQKNAAKSGSWVTVTKDETTQKTTPWGYNYDTTEPVTKAVYIPPSVAALPEVMRLVYNSDNPQQVIDSIKADPAAWMKDQLNNYAYIAGWNGRAASAGSGEALTAWSSFGGGDATDRNEQVKNFTENANNTAKWLLDNKVMTPDEIKNLWGSKSTEGADTVQRNVLDQIHHDDAGFWGLGKVGEQIGDFQEKYQLAIMASILGGAVLGPLAGATVGAVPGSATAIAVNAATTGLTQTAVALASGAPTNKALLAGGLAAAGAGMGGALGPSGLNVAGSLVNAGMNPTLAAVTVGALGGGALGALSGAASGNVEAGLLGGAISGGISSGVNAATKTFDGMTGTLTRLAAGTAVGMLTGKDISSALQGAAVGTLVGLAGSAAGSAIKAANSGKTDISTTDGIIKPDADTVAKMREAAAKELDDLTGNSNPQSVKQYVESLPDSYFTKALVAVDKEVAGAVATAAAYPTEAVKELYKQETGTEPSEEKLAYWSNELRNGTPLDQIGANIKATADVDGVIDTRNIEKFASTMGDLIKDTQGITDLSSGTQVAANTIALKPGMGTMIDIGASGLSEILPVMKPYVNDVIRAVGALVNPVLGGMAPTELGSGDVYETGTATGTPTIDNPLSDYVNSLRENWGSDIAIELKDVRAALENVAVNENRQSRLAELNKLSDQELGNLVKLGISEVVTPKVINPAMPWEMGDDVINPADVSTDQAGKVINPANVSPGATNIPDVVNPANPVIPTRDVVNPTTDRPTVGTTDVVNPAGDRPITDTGTVAQPRIDAGTSVGTAVQAYPADLAGEIDRVVSNAGVRVDAGVLSDAMVDALARSKAEALSRVRVADLTTALINRIALVPATTAITTPVITKIVDDVIKEVTTEPTTTEVPVDVTTPTTTPTTTKTTTPTTKAPTTPTPKTPTTLPDVSQILKPITGGSDYKAPEGHEIFADVIGGPAKIDLGGRFGAPTIYNIPNTVSNPAGGLVFASGGSVNANDLLTFDNISASIADNSNSIGEDIIGGLPSSGVDVGVKFGDPIIYALSQQQQQQQKSYADGGMVMDGYWPNIALAQQPKNRFKYLHSNLPKVSADAYAEGGHVPEFYSEGGLNNRYVSGNGDGTSDDVPAMLANGEFVIPADVVSALGNGSNDSGAQVLDELLQVIRAHKQNHDPKELPPDSMGPLAYLNKATKKVGK